MPLIPALGKQRQVDLYEFKARLVYRAIPGQAPKGEKKSNYSDYSATYNV